MPPDTDNDTAVVTSTESVPVVTSSGTTVSADDRPIQNVVAEMNRKFTKMNDQINTLTQYVVANQPKQEQTQSGSHTDDELWSLAQQGDRSAYDLYMTRLVDRQNKKWTSLLEEQRIVDKQLEVLTARYPVFNDASHPLTQAASVAYQYEVNQGKPANRATLLSAIKTAIADNPDIISELSGASADQIHRATAARKAQAGQFPTTTRDVSVVSTSPKPLSPSELDLARRMGVREPGKSKERFWQRQKDERSSVGNVASYIKEE